MKKIIITLLTAILCAVPISAFALSDIADHWAKAAIEKLIEEAVVSGYPDGTYRPEQRITREETAALLAKFTVGYEGKKTVVPFTDIAGSWAKSYIETLQKLEVIAGYEDGTFRPQQTITRAEFCTMYSHVLALQKPIDPSEIATLTFTDMAQFSEWMKKPVGALLYRNLISGYPDGSFRPNGMITRAEVASILAKQFAAEEEEEQEKDKFVNMPKEDRDKLDALLRALGAKEGYEVTEVLEGGYTVFLTEWQRSVHVAYNPEFPNPFDVSVPEILSFWEDGMHFGDYFVPLRVREIYQKELEAMYPQPNPGFEFEIHYLYDKGSGEFDRSVVVIDITFEDGKTNEMHFAWDVGLIWIKDWTVGRDELRSMPPQDQQRLKKSLHDLGAGAEYGVMEIRDTELEFYLPDFDEIVVVHYTPGPDDPFEITTKSLLRFTEDGHHIDDYYVPVEEHAPIVQKVRELFDASGYQYVYTMHFEYDSETDTIDPNYVVVDVTFENEASSKVLFSRDGTLIIVI